MKEKWIRYKERLVGFWQKRSMRQKVLMIGGSIALISLLIVSIMVLSKPNYEPLYSNLSPEETGQIKANLDDRGIPSIISDNGTTISVPASTVDQLKVELAAEGIPKSGNIDYTFFGENAGFGMTDNEFNVLEREAMQTELANLIKSIDGVNDADVMINLPEESVWVAQEEQAASASVVLNLAAGKELNQNEINALYNLVSKSVPNLPKENIVIMDQFFNYFDVNEETGSGSYTQYEQQRKIKQDIERDIQRQVQQMLATIVGPDKVVSSVTADIDFTQEQREENLVEPVDPENMEGIAVSVERIRETFEGDPAAAEGIAGTGETDIPEYPGAVGGQVGDYEREEERINNEFNRIRREIVESPYKIRDLGIQVMVEPPDPEDPNSLPPEILDDIEQILASIVQTSIAEDPDAPLDEEAVADKIFVSAQPFNGKPAEEEPVPRIPMWLYIVGGILLLIILFLIFLLLRQKRQESEEELVEDDGLAREEEVSDLELKPQGEEHQRRKQLEKLAKEKPDEFAKLLRTWLSED